MIPDSPMMTIPLHIDENGTIRVGKTRVLLELVIDAFQRGESPEGIVSSYSTLTTSDVYAVIAYYLAHQEEVDAYIRQQDALTAQILAEMEASRTPEQTALRERLKAYKAQQKDHP